MGGRKAWRFRAWLAPTVLAGWLLPAALAGSLAACEDDGDDAGDASTGGVVDDPGDAAMGADDPAAGDGATTPAPDPEAASGLGLVAIYAGTYEVEATLGEHTRGTVTISADGATFDFDAGLSFTIDGENVFNRIPNFPEEPRVQIEIPGSPQQRLRIFVDPADTARPIAFTYDDDADNEDQAVEVSVISGGEDVDAGADMSMGGGDAGSGTTSASPLPGDKFGASFDADGVGVLASLDAQPAVPITGVGDERFLELGGGAVVSDGARLRMLPIGQTGEFQCGQGPSDFRLVEMIVMVSGATYRADKDGGSCTIQVTRADSLYEGTFSGSLVGEGGTVSVTNGIFRNDGSSL